MSTWQFVDSIAASPAVRLDLNSVTGGLVLTGEPELSPPQLRRVVTSSMLADGDLIPAAAFTNRAIQLPLRLLQGSTDSAADKLQVLARELVRRPGNILRVMVGSSPLFFRTFPAPDAAYQLMLKAPQLGQVTLSVPCEPFGYGLEETLGAVTVYNDPAEGVTLNSNPFFEVNANNWSPTGGTFARTTAQFHEGAASGLLTPSGAANSVFVECEEIAVTAGQAVRGSAWMRNATARSVQLRIDWYDAAHAFNSQSTLQTTSVTANTWTYFDGVATAPVTGYARLTPLLSGTPVPAADLLYVDEARIRFPATNGGMFLDVAAPKGDVETPLTLTVAGTVGTGGGGSGGQRQSGIAVRRRGTPSAAPLVLQAEAMTQGTNTTTQANSSVMSGPGNNYSRCTFGTPGMTDRLTTATRFPSSPSTDARGTYRVYARVRQTVGTDVIDVRLLWGSTAVQVTNGTTRLPVDSGAGAPTIKYVDLGLIQIPVGYDPVYDGLTGVELATEGVYLILQAQRVSGSGNLDVDLLLFWPVDDRAEITQFPAIQNTPSDVFVVEGGPRPAVYCLNVSNQIVSTAPVQISGTGVMISPGRVNRVFFALDLGTSTSVNGAGNVITDSVVVTPAYFPRYLFPLKPAST